MSARARIGRAVLVLLAGLALAACAPSIGATGDWRAEARCQPQENPAPGDDPGDGSVASPEEILPDPADCPEAYAGGGPSTAPPVPGPTPSPADPPGTYPSDPDPCARPESANGFPCTSVPGVDTPIYPTPVPGYTDP